MTSSPENIRYFVAGRMACAQALAKAGNSGSASFILKIVRAYLDMDNVKAPPAYTELVDAAIIDPVANIENMALLEEWLCHPFNTIIEQSLN